MATHSSILAWKIPWTEDPGGLQSRGSQRFRINWAIERTCTHTHTHTHTHTQTHTWEDIRVWAHWDYPFHMRLSRLGPASCFHILSFLSSGLIVGSGYSLMTARRQVFFCLSSLRAHWLTWRAAITDDCDIPVYWYGRKHSISLYYKAMKIKEVLLLFTTTRKTLVTIMLNERSQTQKIIYGMIPFRRSRTGKS